MEWCIFWLDFFPPVQWSGPFSAADLYYGLFLFLSSAAQVDLPDTGSKTEETNLQFAMASVKTVLLGCWRMEQSRGPPSWPLRGMAQIQICFFPIPFTYYDSESIRLS